MEKVPFHVFGKAIDQQFALMQTTGVLVTVDVNPDVLWNFYLDSFPEGTNPVFRERREYDCNCCRSFIRRMGNVISISPTGIKTLWDVNVEGYYQTVADSMASFIKSKSINDYFLSTEKAVGTKATPDNKTNGLVWNHYWVPINKENIIGVDYHGTKLGELRATKDVFKRGLEAFSLEAAETVLELITQGSLYRGSEHKAAVENFIKYKKQFDSIKDSLLKEIFIWDISKRVGPSVRFRSSVIGTLVEDISEGKELEYAVNSFETKVAPTNYKRATAVVSASMIKQAQETIQELDLENSLYRRFAAPTDININNLLFSSVVEKPTDLFSELTAQANNKVIPKQLAKIEEISVDKFIKDVLPLANKVEILFQNKHSNNLMSLIAPVHEDSKNLFRWDNKFSWAYSGDITDSIKERVKAAGGNVKADLRASLAWFNYDDLDLFVIEPNGNRIYFGNRNTPSPYSGGKLDVDMNAGSGRTREAVENIIFPNKNRMPKGSYSICVNNFSKRENTDIGFDIQIEADGKIYNFNYPKAVANKENICVCNVIYDGSDFTISSIHSDVKTSISSREVWGISTETFIPVSMIMNSPNYWDNQTIGNKHLFFILENCKNPDSARGFFNEFLTSDLEKHRKVFELLGSKTKAEPTDNQVSGLGFSETKRDEVIVRVTGKTYRTFVIKF